jgi:hypothetical protein
MACGGGTPTCAGVMCNTAAPSCNCAGGSSTDAGGNTSGGIICANDPCDPYCMENDQIDAGLDGGAGLGPIGVQFDAGQVPASEINDLNHECPDGSCGGGGDAAPDAAPPSGTTISGKIYDPGVNVPLPNIIVFQPTVAGPAGLTAFPADTFCDTCASLASPDVATTTTDSTGSFTLPITGTTNVPIVIQTGRWRREITIGATAACPTCDTTPIMANMNNHYTACTTATAPTCLWRLPRSGSAAGAAACGANCASSTIAEGSMPAIAIATTSQESVECDVAEYMGGAWEMGPPSAGTAITVFQDNGAQTTPSTTAASTLYSGLTSTSPYDVIIIGCPSGGGDINGLSVAEKDAFVSWTENGGKLFLDHHAGDDLTNSGASGIAPLTSTSTWTNGSGTFADIGLVSGANAAQTIYKNWLTGVGAYGTPGVNTPQATNDALIPNATAFSWLTGSSGGTHSLSFSWDMGTGGVIAPGASGVCGRVVYNSMHVEQTRGSSGGGDTFPSSCSLSPDHGGTGIAETGDEDSMEFMFFALTSCSILPQPTPTPAPSGCENYQVSGTPQAFYSCQMDTYCDPLSGGGTGDCIPFSQGQTWAAGPREMAAGDAPTIDLTVEQGCSNPAGGYYQFVPICNRGTGTLAAGTAIALALFDFATAGPPLNPPGGGAPGGLPTAGELGAGAPCSVTVPAGGLAAGSCMLLNVATQCTPTETMALGYDQLMFVNSNYAITEGNLTPNSTIATLASQSVQPGYANNWGILSDGTNAPACSSSTSYTMQNGTYQYTSTTCPMGTHGQWGLLTYNTTIPTTPATDASPVETPEVIFEVATQAIQLDGGLGPLTPYATVADVMGVNGGVNLGDPPVCQSSGPATTTPASACLNGTDPTPPCCPKSITSALEEPTPEGLGPLAGQVASTNSLLSLKIVVNPSANGKLTATVNNWQISFDCVPSE